jgi:hypothetical protein
MSEYILSISICSPVHPIQELAVHSLQELCLSMLLTAFCTEASESIAVFVNQLIPTFTLCSSVGILRQYTSFRAAEQSLILFTHR